MCVKGVVGMFVTNRSDDGEDVGLYEDEAARAAGNPMHTFCMLRQQAEKENDKPYLSQADFIAPKGYKSRKHYARMDLKPLKDVILICLKD
jgi:5-methyltetrahydrofolate--homocysteine methyltransferase